MTLRTAFVLSLLAVLGVMAVPAIYGVGTVRSMRGLAVDIRSRTAEAGLAVARIRVAVERLDRYQRAYIATGDPELGDRSRALAQEIQDHLVRLDAAGYGEAVAEADLQAPALRSLVELTGLLMESGLPEAATVALRQELAPMLEDAADASVALAAALDAVTAAELSRIDRISGRAVIATTAALLVALVIATLLAILAARVLTRPLNRLSSSMARVAAGEMEPPPDLPYDRSDEVGQLLRAFRSMARKLEDLDRLKAEFVGLASHDMKTPVNVIHGYSELLAESLGPDADPRTGELLDALRDEARSLSARADQLLQLSRIRSTGLRLGLEEVNVRHLANAAAEQASAAARRHDIDVAAAVDGSAPTFIVADPDRLHREVFDNLFGNAIKFSPRGSGIRLLVYGLDGSVAFEIVDEGAPIPPGILPHVFDGLDRGRVPGGRGGADLGLPIARAAVEAHGGSIEVDSAGEAGVVFRILLPVHPPNGRGRRG